ncbi:hypothetical protein GCM10022207_73690 [Streptomyces lannensis]|uniref:Uncharacterized protein n=1 Tax=Streptomyces lannensis TaxID=766498 RepID=A0ABP7L4I0_9ACTN
MCCSIITLCNERRPASVPGPRSPISALRSGSRPEGPVPAPGPGSSPSAPFPVARGRVPQKESCAASSADPRAVPFRDARREPLVGCGDSCSFVSAAP